MKKDKQKWEGLSVMFYPALAIILMAMAVGVPQMVRAAMGGRTLGQAIFGTDETQDPQPEATTGAPVATPGAQAPDDTDDVPTITSKGVGIAVASADMARIAVTASAIGPSAKAAADKLEATTASVSAALAKAGCDVQNDLVMEVAKVQSWTDEHLATRTITATMRSDAAISASVQAAASMLASVDGVDAVRASYLLQGKENMAAAALSRATQQAQANASSIASAAGMQVGRMVSLREGPATWDEQDGTFTLTAEVYADFQAYETDGQGAVRQEEL